MDDTLKSSRTRNAFETRVLFGGLTAREDDTAAITLMGLVSISFERGQDDDDQVEKEEEKVVRDRMSEKKYTLLIISHKKKIIVVRKSKWNDCAKV